MVKKKKHGTWWLLLFKAFAICFFNFLPGHTICWVTNTCGTLQRYLSGARSSTVKHTCIEKSASIAKVKLVAI